MNISKHTDKLIELALSEDLGTGDVTTEHLVAPAAMGHGTIVAKEDLVISGLDVARRVYNRIDTGVMFQSEFIDGDRIKKHQTAATLSGKLAALLTGERAALNFLQRLSGIATHVQNFIKILAKKDVTLLDTRKTTPGWRELEKYAVRTGGGTNHRMGLYDAVLIKDNHIAACGSISKAVACIKAEVGNEMTIEVETTNINEVKEALDASVDIIMLDNMSLEQIKLAVDLVGGRSKLEVSGGITREHLADLADTGIDYISSGALTHSARAVDLSMCISAAM